MVNIFEEFMRGRQLAQQDALTRYKLAQDQMMQPYEQQLKQLQIERERAMLDLAPFQLKKAQLEAEQAGKTKYQQASGKGLEGYTFNPDTGTYDVDPKLRAQIEQNALNISGKSKLEIKDISSINKDLTALTKDATMIKGAATSLADLKDSSSPAAKLAAVFKFMKALDPTSVVRETEQGQVYESQGVPQNLLGMINNLTGSGKLTGQAFKDIVDTSKLMANSAITSSRESALGYLDVYSELDQDRRRLLEGRIPSPFDVQQEAEQEKPPIPQPSKPGGQLMKDANGNSAYVYPDGTFEEI